MAKYYFAEIQGRNSYREVEALKAQTLATAKREASRKQAFYGTRLEIGTALTPEGFLRDLIAYKEDGVWH